MPSQFNIIGSVDRIVTQDRIIINNNNTTTQPQQPSNQPSSPPTNSNAENEEQNEIPAGLSWNQRYKGKTLDQINQFLCEPKGFIYPISTGHVYILNNEKFERDSRIGSENDVKGLEYFFKTKLGWKHVEITRDLKADAMKDWLINISRRDFSRFSALFVIIMSHGNDKGIYGVDSVVMEVEPLLHCFSAREENCPSLAGKPKFFIFQACRGDKDDEGYSLSATDAIVQEPSRMINIPAFSDFLICYPCIKGYTAVRNERNGTLYVQTLVDALLRFYDREHIVDILTRVNWRISQSNNQLTIKSMPCFEHSLRMKCYFDDYFTQIALKIRNLGNTK